MVATVQQISEGALERVLARLLKQSPEEAAEVRAYFDRNRAFFLRLGWAVVNRLIERWAPPRAAEEAVKRYQAALVKAEPTEAEGLARWFADHHVLLQSLAQGMAQEAAPHVVAHAESGLSLLLRADPNLDFAPGSHEATVKIAPRWFSLDSLTEGRELVDRFIKEYQLGGGNWTGGHVRKQGVPFARFSYNRRLWLLVPDGRETQTELDLQGNPIFPRAEEPLMLSPSGMGARSAPVAAAQITDWRLARPSIPPGIEPVAQMPESASFPPPAQLEAVAPPIDLDSQRSRGQRWIERKVSLPLQEADYQQWHPHAVKRRTDALHAANQGQAAFWAGAIEWLEARKQGVPLVVDRTARQEEGRLWIASKMQGPTQAATRVRWRFAAHEKFKEAQARGDESSVAFWQGVVAWLEERLLMNLGFSNLGRLLRSRWFEKHRNSANVSVALREQLAKNAELTRELTEMKGRIDALGKTRS